MSAAAIAFGMSAGDAESRDDAALLTSLGWRTSGDRKLIAAARKGDVATFCKALRRSFAKRRAASATKSKPARTVPQLLQPLWSQQAWDDPATTEPLSRLLIDVQKRVAKATKSGGKPSRAASQRVTAGLKAAPPGASPWAQVVWLTLLFEAADVLDDHTLLSVWRRVLVGVMAQPEGDPDETSGGEVGLVDDRQLLLTGELPWLSGLVFADVKGAGKVQRVGRSQLCQRLEALTDGDGTPHARAVHRLPLTLAVLTRSLSMGRRCGESLFRKQAADRFEQLVIRAAAMARADGQLALSNGASFATGSLLQTASALVGIRASAPPFRRVQSFLNDLPSNRSPTTKQATRLPKIKRRRTSNEGESPSTQSDWAELTCMRNNWSAGGDSCIIAHHAAAPQLCVTAFERLLIDGDWLLEVEVDGLTIDLPGDWSCVCWFSDEDADYVELQQETDEGVALLRQVLLSRTDHWLLLADNVKLDAERCGDGATVRLTSRLPFAETVTLSDNRWTREVGVRCQKLNAHAYPLAIEQERVRRADGSLTIDGNDLVLSQTSRGGGLHMPLVIDWSPDRQCGEAEWRQLTVAEDGRALPRNVASGQRLRIGRHQWLFYRSHQPGETGRSILGHHTPHETVIAEFTSLGEVEPILVVE